MSEPAGNEVASAPSHGRRALAEASALVLLVLAGTLVQRGSVGVQAPWLALAVLAAGSLFRRALVFSGRVSPAPAWTIALELAGLASALVASIPLGLALEGLALLASGLAGAGAGSRESPAASDREATWLERAAPLALGALALAWFAVHDPGRGYEGSGTFVLVSALAAAFSFAPGASRSVRATGRRFGTAAILAAEALLVAHLETPARIPAEHATRALAVAAVALELRAFVLERGPAPAPVPTLVRGARLALGAVALVFALVLVPYPLLAHEQRIDLASLPSRVEGLARAAALPAPGTFGLDAPGPARLLVDGEPRGLEEARARDVSEIGSGTFAVAAGTTVVWSSATAQDPATDGHRYELAFRPAPHRSRTAARLFELALGLLLVAWSLGAIDLERPSSRAERALLLLLVTAALAATLPGRWDRLQAGLDTESYLRHSWTRTPLYPALLDALDAHPRDPREPLGPTTITSAARPHPGQRFLAVVHAQKLLALASLAVLLWTLSGSINAWVLVAIAWVAILVDAAQATDAGVAHNLESLLSEGLNQTLVFLYVAAALAYFRRPGWVLGLALAGLVSLLLLCRPANAPLAIVFLFVALRQARELGWKRALVHAAALGLAAWIPIGLASFSTYRATGYFRLHAFTGPNIFCTTLSLATPEDVDAFQEPDLHELVRRCVLEPPRPRPTLEGYEFVNVNLYEIGLPVLEGMHVLPPPPARDFVRDDMLGAVGKRLLRRHPLAFACLVLRQLESVLSWPVQGPLVAFFLAGAWLSWRRRRPLDLFVAFLAPLPILAILPSCAFNVPLERYRSPLAFVELVAVPLFLSLLLEREDARASSSGASSPRAS